MQKNGFICSFVQNHKERNSQFVSILFIAAIYRKGETSPDTGGQTCNPSWEVKRLVTRSWPWAKT
jgi:hypothetical protein